MSPELVGVLGIIILLLVLFLLTGPFCFYHMHRIDSCQFGEAHQMKKLHMRVRIRDCNGAGIGTWLRQSKAR